MKQVLSPDSVIAMREEAVEAKKALVKEMAAPGLERRVNSCTVPRASVF